MFVLLPVLLLVLVIAALVDIITRQEWQVKHLPKLVWVLLVVFLPLVGSILWFVLGREYTVRSDLGGFGDPRRSEISSRGRQFSPQESPGVPPDSRGLSTEEQLAELELEIERHNKQLRIRRMEQQLNEKRPGSQ